MKHIAFVAHLSEISGSGVALLETVSGLAKDFEVSLILPGSGPLLDRALQKGIKTVILANPEVAISEAGMVQKCYIAVKRLKYVNELRAYFRSNGITLVYVNTSASIFPALAARLAGLPIAWHIHETLDTRDLRTKWKKRIIRSWANAIIFASNSSKQFLPPPANMPSIIARNYIQMGELAPMAKARLALPDNQQPPQPVLVMNGTIQRKGADILLTALLQLCKTAPRLQPQVIITGLPPTEPAFASRIAELGATPELHGRITFVGIQSSLTALLATADLFISPARNEALPIAVVEAMAAGVPVIATDVGDCADLLNYGQCGWVLPPEDPAALAVAIEEALTRPELSRAKAEAAFAKVSNLYGSKDFWEPLKALLLSL